jgi:hypothetical protein
VKKLISLFFLLISVVGFAANPTSSVVVEAPVGDLLIQDFKSNQFVCNWYMNSRFTVNINDTHGNEFFVMLENFNYNLSTGPISYNLLAGDGEVMSIVTIKDDQNGLTYDFDALETDAACTFDFSLVSGKVQGVFRCANLLSKKNGSALKKVNLRGSFQCPYSRS